MCGGNGQPGFRVEEKREVNDRRRRREVAQDEMQRAVRGSVKGLAGAEGEDIVGLPQLELPLRHEQGGPVLEPGRAPCCQALTTLYHLSTSPFGWVRGSVSSFKSLWPRVMGGSRPAWRSPEPWG